MVFFAFEALGVSTLKVGVLAPEGTTWANHLKEMASAISEATEERVEVKFYFGGTQGDEADVLRKIRIGQLHGGIFTGKTLGDIHGDTRVLELPFNFYSDREKGLKTMKALAPYLDEKIGGSEFVNLGFVEIGQVYFVSQKEVHKLDDLKGIKIWSWEGDRLTNTILDEMKLIAVPLALPDVLSSLSNGVIEAAYAPPLGILALQWHTKIRYLIDFPLAYSIGAFLVHKKPWGTIGNKDRNAVVSVARRFVDTINKSNAKDNDDALEVMKSMGITFLNFPETEMERARALREKVIERLKGSYFSQRAYDMLVNEL